MSSDHAGARDGRYPPGLPVCLSSGIGKGFCRRVDGSKIVVPADAVDAAGRRSEAGDVVFVRVAFDGFAVT